MPKGGNGGGKGGNGGGEPGIAALEITGNDDLLGASPDDGIAESLEGLILTGTGDPTADPDVLLAFRTEGGAWQAVSGGIWIHDAAAQSWVYSFGAAFAEALESGLTYQFAFQTAEPITRGKNAGGVKYAYSTPYDLTVAAATPAPVVTGYSASPGNLLVGNVTDDATPTVEGLAPDGAIVVVLVDGVPAGSTPATGGNWSFTLGALAEGSHAITAVAEVDGVSSVPSDPATLIIDLTPPSPPRIGSIAEDTGYPAPDTDFLTSDKMPDISGTASPGETVEVFIDDGGGPVSIGTALAGAAGDWTLVWTGTALADGDYTLTAQATDGLGRQSALSAGRNLSIDATAPATPAVVVVYDADGGVSPGEATDDTTPDIAGVADPLTAVEILIDGSLAGTEVAAADGTWFHAWTGTPLADDSAHTVSVVSIDAAGNRSASAPFHFVVNTPTLPAPVILSWGEDSGIGDASDPSRSDGITNDGSIRLAGTSIANATIEIHVDGVLWGTTGSDASGNWSIDGAAMPTLVVDGSYGFTALARIGDDYSTASDAVAVTIDASAPEGTAVTSVSRADGSFSGGGQSDDTTPDIRGLAEAGALIDVRIDGALLGSTTADGAGQWALAWPGGPPLTDGSHAVTATATDVAGNTSSPSAPFALVVDTSPAPPPSDSFTPTDDLYSTQWHLRRMGDLERVWGRYTGDGVAVGVYDEGVEASHPDLDGNYVGALHAVITSGELGVTDGAHGTAVAGIIASEADGSGTVGVAFGASLAGVNIITGDASANSADRTDFYLALDHLSAFDVTNHSWGWGPGFGSGATQAERDDTVAFHAEAVPRFAAAAAEGRGGLGTVLVKSGGNGSLFLLSEPENAQQDRLNTIWETILVGAVQENGHVPGYSARGANLLVAAPSSGNLFAGAAIQTTDLTGEAGLAAGDYTGTDITGFGGTSAAAPMVSGVVALMLEANPGLGWRDVQTVLAYSSRHTGTAINEVPSPLYGDERDVWEFNAARDWNGGGLHFSNDYGFGTVDAHAAVRMAEVWSCFGPALRSDNIWSGSVSNAATTGAGVNGVSFSWPLGGYTDIELEYVELTVRVPDPTVSVQVTSGQGTVATLYAPQNDPGGLPGLDWTFGINAFRGEDITGDWSVEVVGVDGGTPIAVDLAWYGVRNGLTAPGYSTEDDTFTYTDEMFGTIVRNGSVLEAIVDDPARTTLLDPGGSDWLNMAAMTGDLDVDLGAGAVDMTRGVAFLTIPAGTVIENAVSGDGDDTLVGTAGDNILLGMRGDDLLEGLDGADILLGGAGSDTLTGGAGADSFGFVTGFGEDIVTDFEQGLDVIDVSGFAEISNLADFMAGAFEDAGDVIFDAGADLLNRIVFAETTLSGFDVSDFDFGSALIA